MKPVYDSDIREYVQLNADKIIDKIESDGIVFEGEFNLASTILKETELISEILSNNGLTVDLECIGCEVNSESGWLYAIYNREEIIYREAEIMIKKFFNQ